MAEIKEVDHSSVSFGNGKAVVNDIYIKFSATKYSDKVSGTLTIDRKNAKIIIKELQDHLKPRTSKQHLAWDKRRRLKYGIK